MSLSDWFRRLFSSRPAAAEPPVPPGEEPVPSDAREADIGPAAEMETSAGGLAPGVPGTPAAAEAAEAEIASQEAPPDPAP